MPALDPGLERRLSLWGRWWKSISTLLPRESAQWFWHLRPASIFVVQMIYKYFPLVSPRAREERSHQTLWSENMKVRTRLCVCAPKFPLPITHILSISTHTVSSISKHTHTHTTYSKYPHTHNIYAYICTHISKHHPQHANTHKSCSSSWLPSRLTGWRGEGERGPGGTLWGTAEGSNHWESASNTPDEWHRVQSRIRDRQTLSSTQQWVNKSPNYTQLGRLFMWIALQSPQ